MQTRTNPLTIITTVAFTLAVTIALLTVLAALTPSSTHATEDGPNVVLAVVQRPLVFNYWANSGM